MYKSQDERYRRLHGAHLTRRAKAADQQLVRHFSPAHPQTDYTGCSVCGGLFRSPADLQNVQCSFRNDNKNGSRYDLISSLKAEERGELTCCTRVLYTVDGDRY